MAASSKKRSLPWCHATPLAVAAALLLWPLVGTAQAPHALTAAEQHQVDTLVSQMSLEQKLAYIGGTGFAARAVPSLKIPALEMSDGPYGTRSNSGFPSTTYAAGIGLAASWDRALASELGAGIGRDARARGVHFMLGPGVNIYRSPRNGRNFEYFGEDPYLSGQIAAGYIQGMQQQGVSATVKHFLGNNSEFLRHDSDTEMDERTAREIYLPAFEAAVKQGHVSAVMDSYNLIDGKHATENPYFNIDILRKDWGFQGVLMSDWDATYDAVGAADAGLDIEMPTGKFMNQANLMPAIKAGTVTQATIDEKVRHLLSTAVSYGWLERDQRDPSIGFLDKQNQAVARKAAQEGAVLLKNEGKLLPLQKQSLKSILVVGPNAYPGVPVGGGSAGVVPFHLVSGLEGISDAVDHNTTVLYDAGLPTMKNLSGHMILMTEAGGGKPGATLETWSNVDLQGAPASSTIVPGIGLEGLSLASLIGNLDSALATIFSSPPKAISHRFTGYYTAASAGKYIVILEDSGEGSGNRVFVDGKQVIDNWKLVRAYQPHISLDLAAGPHKVVVEESQTSILGGHLGFAIVAEDKVVNKRALELAAKADVVVMEAGFQQESESEGGDRTFSLPFGQAELIRELSAANPKLVVAITSGGNVDSSNWIEKVPAVLETWYAGQEGGHALADILFGAVNPSGHLPATFERRAEDNPTFGDYYPEEGTRVVHYKEGIFVGYRGYEKNHVEPLFPFGYGLSYTTFRFANLSVQPAQGAGASASFDITNTGTRQGADVAQLYVTEDHAKVERPAHELKGFERVDLAPGATRHVTIPLDARAFSYYDVAQKRWVIGSKNFTISVGDSVASLPLKAALTLASTNVP
ncbi:glycoside hydrolase [Acidipila sp. EB88]|nr:glycoside hydrolase [Acidipila sp. EB88]